MIRRYQNRTVIKNDMEQYSDVFRNRNVNYIYQYTSPSFTYIDSIQYSNLIIYSHVWKEGDRYYKLANEYYANSKYWWVIAKFNLKPTESHVKIGNILSIPAPLDRVLDYMRG